VSSSAAAGSVTLVSVSTIAADEDFEFRLDEPATNTRTTATRYAVSSVPDGTHIAMAVSVPIIADGQYIDWQAEIWTAAVAGSMIARTRITGSVAATDIIAVLDSTGVNNTHYVQFVQVEGAGEIPCYADHPLYSQIDPTGYGIKVAELSRPMLGVQQLVPNAWMRTWSNPVNPPDGWTWSGVATLSQNTNASFTRYGGASIHVQTNSGVITSPTFYHATTDGNTTLSVRTNIYSVSLGDGMILLEIVALKADGTAGAVVASVKVGGGSYVGGDATLIANGTWVELKVSVNTIALSGDPASASNAAFGLKARISPTIVIDPIDVYIDTVEAYTFNDCPSEAFEFGDAPALLQAANNQLRLVASPPQFYTLGILDLARIMPSEYARLAQTLGANVRAVDPEYSTDTTVRLLSRRRALTDASQTDLTLANRPTLLSNLQQLSAETQRRVIDAVNAGSDAAVSSGPTFVALPSDTTLLPKAEISTSTGTGFVITLPSVDPASPEENGSSVTYVPPDPTTTPTVVITAGRPPSRRKPIPIY
jgi:hypothetical protein